MRTPIAATVLLAGLALAAQPPDPKIPDVKFKEEKGPVDPVKPPSADPKVAPSALEGGYTVAYLERDGRPVPPAEYKDAIVRITSGRVVGTDRDRNELLVASFPVDLPAMSPWKLELKMLAPTPKPTVGLAKKDGNVLTFIYARPGYDAPTEYKTKPGQTMFVLRGFVMDPLPPPNKFSSSP